jgi:hypothetical protein
MIQQIMVPVEEAVLVVLVLMEPQLMVEMVEQENKILLLELHYP